MSAKTAICLIVGHKWERIGYPSKDDDINKDDTQLFRCQRCWAMPLVKHNGSLPRFVWPVHWNRRAEYKQLQDKIKTLKGYAWHKPFCKLFTKQALANMDECTCGYLDL